MLPKELIIKTDLSLLSLQGCVASDCSHSFPRRKLAGTCFSSLQEGKLSLRGIRKLHERCWPLPCLLGLQSLWTTSFCKSYFFTSARRHKRHLNSSFHKEVVEFGKLGGEKPFLLAATFPFLFHSPQQTDKIWQSRYYWRTKICLMCAGYCLLAKHSNSEAPVCGAHRPCKVPSGQ